MSSDEVENFTLEVIGKLNINLTDPENEFRIFNSEIGRYARQSKITRDEFFLARTLLSRGMLNDFDGEILKPYKKIDYEMFNQMEEAYLRYRNHDKLYEKGLNQIADFLNPPPEEPSEEQKRAQKDRQIEDVKKCIAEFGVCEYGFLIYDEICKDEDFQELRKTFPEVYDRNFNKWITRQKKSEKAYLSKQDLKNAEQRHAEVMDRLKSGKPVKKGDMEGAPYQYAKSELVEKYYKKNGKNI